MEVLKKSGKPVGMTMCIGPEGDLHGVSAGDCAVKLAKAGKKRKKSFLSSELFNQGVDFVGVNCHFGPTKSLDAIRAMKDALKANGFEKMHLMVQPLGYHTPDAGKQGFIDLPEFPFGM